uniref:Uncharacterized protein n=1 Tax=Arundo donax TaxID=35708 RepID=A0A0A9B611_ARUDO
MKDSATITSPWGGARGGAIHRRGAQERWVHGGAPCSGRQAKPKIWRG